MPHFCIPALLLLILASWPVRPAPSGGQAPSNAIAAEVAALNASMLDAFKRDPATVASFYADDALVVGGGQRADGKEQVAAYWRGATMFSDWKLEVLHVGGTAAAPWQYGRSVLVGRSGRTMDTYFLGLLRRDPAGSLKWVVDAYGRDRKPIGPAESQRITEAWRSAVGGDAAAMSRIRRDPFSILAETPAPAGDARSPFDGPERTVLDSTSVTVPLTEDGGFYYATVDLNGRPYRFTLETGAGFFGISSRAAQALGLPVERREVLPGSSSPVTMVESVRMGGATFTRVPARVMSQWDGGSFDGIISIPLLRDALATLDLGTKALRLERGELPPPNGRDIVAMAGQDRGRRVDLPISIGDVQVAAVLDTRADFWLIVPNALQPRLALAAPPVFVTKAYGPSVGEFDLRGARVTGPVRIGHLTLQAPAVLLREPASVLIGVPLLEQVALTIDQKNRRVRLARPAGETFSMPQQPWETAAKTDAGGAASTPRSAPSPGAQPGDPPPGTWTVGFMMRGAGGGPLSVARVFPGSSAEKAGLRVGDQVLELDGTAAAAMSPAVARATASRGTPFRLVVQRGSERLELTLTPYRIPEQQD